MSTNVLFREDERAVLPLMRGEILENHVVLNGPITQNP